VPGIVELPDAVTRTTRGERESLARTTLRTQPNPV
jgi:hypothetical protein